MKRRILIGIVIITIAVAMVVVAFFAIGVKRVANDWLWQKPVEEYPKADYVPPCDTMLVKNEFERRSAKLRTSNPHWECYGDDEWDLMLIPNEHWAKHCPKGLALWFCTSGQQAGTIWERELYKSGKELLKVSSDLPEGAVDTVCECVEIKFNYCERKVQYTLETGEENYKYWDGVEYEDLTRAEADSVLHSWGIERELPPEDHPWLYREEQLLKAKSKDR